MKANLIISTEYKYNQPSVFIFANGEYYGCLIYPSIRNYPQDVNYWKDAMSSDSHRGFGVYDVEYSDEEFELIKNLQNSISANNALLKQFPAWEKGPEYSVKRGKAYEEYLAWNKSNQDRINEVSAYNAPYDKAIYVATTQLRKLLLSKRNEN